MSLVFGYPIRLKLVQDQWSSSMEINDGEVLERRRPSKPLKHATQYQHVQERKRPKNETDV